MRNHLSFYTVLFPLAKIKSNQIIICLIVKETAQKDPSKWTLKFQSCEDPRKWSAFCPGFPDAVAPIFQACRG